LESGFPELQIVRAIRNIFYSSFKIFGHLSAWTHLINLNMVMAKFIRPDFALKDNYKSCSVLRYTALVLEQKKKKKKKKKS
jgi:hypothetical protein